MATPLHFGDRRRPLFGLYHDPSGGRVGPAVLICAPFGEEAIRAHRMLRLLAERLSAAGHPVLRFDYGGSGDSSGDGTELTLDSAADDILLAHEELEALSAATKVGWLGVRFGALAMSSARERALTRPHRLIAWDPVEDPPDYASRLGGSGAAGHEGFPVANALLDQLAAFQSAATFDEIVVTGASGEPNDHWNSDDALNAFQVPRPTLARIEEVITAW
jgi:hypothetical protein